MAVGKALPIALNNPPTKAKFDKLSLEMSREAT